MKPYGVPRHLDIESPDLIDIRNYGFKSSSGRCKSKSGDIKNSFRKPQSKQRARRVWKKKERVNGKKQCLDE